MTCAMLTLQVIILIIVLVILQTVLGISWALIAAVFVGLACITVFIALLEAEN